MFYLNIFIGTSIFEKDSLSGTNINSLNRQNNNSRHFLFLHKTPMKKNRSDKTTTQDSFPFFTKLSQTRQNNNSRHFPFLHKTPTKIAQTRQNNNSRNFPFLHKTPTKIARTDKMAKQTNKLLC